MHATWTAATVCICQCMDRLRPGPVVFGVQPSAKTEASRFTMLPEAALGSVASERHRWLFTPHKFGTGVNLAT